LQTTNSFYIAGRQTVSKDGDSILANNLLPFICSTASGVYDDTCEADLLSVSFIL
jgi:hypothetical protein